MCALLLASCGGGELAMTPDTGSERGGDAVRIAGDDFLGHGTLVVWFGSEAGRQVVIHSDTLVTVVAPPAKETGSVSVRLEFADGTEHDVPHAYVYEPGKGIVIGPRE